MTPLTIQAGERAYARIQRDGLRTDDIAAVFGASGAAKWLGIYGLDSAIFSQWLRPATQRILLYGTSVGAFKLAAAAQADPAAAFKRLADSYIEQNYSEGLSPEAIASETERIIDTVLPPQAIADVLNSSKYIFSCAAVQCSGPLASAAPSQQRLGMLHAALRSILPRGRGARAGVMQDAYKRVIFAHPDAATWLHPTAGQLHNLCEQTFKPAILASGSL
ncbi:MAG: patatin-like phospholipase family protein, partial [Pseudomonadales bacterium]|nr:patatin-like phospholipase family protein [Gammaproteobacteria bacterium]NNL56820.1 patatin-like phospholipase family protein [Pseudomonadales bacterium]